MFFSNNLWLCCVILWSRPCRFAAVEQLDCGDIVTIKTVLKVALLCRKSSGLNKLPDFLISKS